MQTRHATRRPWESSTHSARNGHLPALSRGADKHHSAEGAGRTRRRRGRRLVRHAWYDAAVARELEFLQRRPVDDHLSPCVFASQSGAVGETQGLGGHAASARAARETNQRKTAQLFFITS